MQQKPYFSFIIPVFNEEENISTLYKEILFTAKKLKKPFEIIFINDGSTDNTLKILSKQKPIKIISFRKNYGQSAALDAGIKEAQGKILFTLDGDGQNDPKDIPTLLQKLEEGYDVVCGWRKKRNDTFTKRFISKGAAYLRSIFVKDTIHDAGCTLRAFTKDCFESIDLYGEMHRMIPALLRWEGYKITEIPVNHRARLHGKSKYNWKRIIKGFIDMINVWFWRKYENRPLYLFGSVGLLFIGIGMTLGIVLTIGRVLKLFSLSDKIWPLMAVFFLLFGMQVFISGLIANIIIKQKYSITKTMPYKISERFTN